MDEPSKSNVRATRGPQGIQSAEREAKGEGTFSFELQSPINDPTVLTMTDGAFDVPVSVH
jgi:hypothetical protein